jgi:hypothetical protein
MSRNLWAYPFPLSDGTIAVIQLPPDLARRDAERLKAFIDALVDDEAGSADPPTGGTL